MKSLQAVLPCWHSCQMLGRFPPCPSLTWTGCPLKNVLTEVLSSPLLCLVHLESTKLKLLLFWAGGLRPWLKPTSSSSSKLPPQQWQEETWSTGSLEAWRKLRTSREAQQLNLVKLLLSKPLIKRRISTWSNNMNERLLLWKHNLC